MYLRDHRLHPRNKSVAKSRYVINSKQKMKLPCDLEVPSMKIKVMEGLNHMTEVKVSRCKLKRVMQNFIKNED